MNVGKIALIALFSVVSVFGFSAITFATSSEEDLQALLEALEESAAAEDSEAVVEEDTSGEEEHQAAEDILDELDDDMWSYSAEEEISLEAVESTSATIKVTEILYDDKPVEKYKIYYSTETLATFQDYDQIQDVIVSIDKVEEDMVYLMLENLAPSTKYYVVVAPVHPTDESIEPLTMISEEISFTTTKAVISSDTKVFNGVSYTYEDAMVTLTWEPSELGDNAEIQIRHQSESSYTTIGSPDLGNGSFKFSVDKSGNFFLKMIALDGEGEPVGKEHIQTMKIEEVEAPEEVVEAAPEVGPTTDMIIALLVLSFIVYMVYRFRRARV